MRENISYTVEYTVDSKTFRDSEITLYTIMHSGLSLGKSQDDN